MNRQTVRLINKQTSSQTDRLINRQTSSQTDKRIEYKLIDRQIDRWTDI